MKGNDIKGFTLNNSAITTEAERGITDGSLWKHLGAFMTMTPHLYSKKKKRLTKETN